METEMERRRREYRRNCIVLIVLFLSFLVAGSFIWSLNPVEDYVGRWMDFLDPKRSERLWNQFEDKSDRKLLRLLDHGDMAKSSVAASILAKRGNPGVFQDVAKKLQSSSEEVRMSARRILPNLDREKAADLLMAELNRLDKSSFDYSDTLRILAYMKYEPVFSYLVNYAKSGPEGSAAVASGYFEELGDPRAIPVLEEALKNITGDDQQSRWRRKDIKEAIEKLQAIAAKAK